LNVIKPLIIAPIPGEVSLLHGILCG